VPGAGYEISTDASRLDRDLYEGVGFRPPAHPERMMEIATPL
jgi:hypothetical protein